MEARLAFAPLLLLVLTGLVLFGGAMFAAVRRPGGAGPFLVGLLGLGLAFVALLGIAVVGSHMSTHRAPYTTVYSPPTSELYPSYVVAPPALPPGHGLTRILGPREVPPLGDEFPLPAVRGPVEAPRPSPEAVAVLAEPTPEWVDAGTVREGDRTFVVVTGRQYADAAASLQDAVFQAAQVVRQDFVSAFRPVGQWLFTPDDARVLAVRNAHTEAIRRTAGENEFTVYRTYLQVELSPEVRHAIEPIWRQQVSTGRSAIAGTILALLTAVAAVFAGYLRFDDRTAGRYRWRLRLASTAALVLIGGTLFAGLKNFPIRSFSAPALPTPIEAPTGPPQVEPPVEVYPEQPQASFPGESHFEFTTRFDCPND